MSVNRPFISGASDSPAMEVEEVRHFKQLQQENAQLKRLLAERNLEIDVMREVLAKKW
jgi:putative transposase